MDCTVHWKLLGIFVLLQHGGMVQPSQFSAPSQLWPLSSDSLAYEVVKNKRMGTMHGRTFVDGPEISPYDAFQLNGTSYVDLDILENEKQKFAFASFVYLDTLGSGVIYEYKRGSSELVLRVYLQGGRLLLESFNTNGTSRAIAQTSQNHSEVPSQTWFQFVLNIDQVARKVQLNKNDVEILQSSDGFLPGHGVRTPGTLRVGKSFAEALPNLQGRITCLRVYGDWVEFKDRTSILEDVDYKAAFFWIKFSGPYGCMYPPCQNGATCTDDNQPGYTCTCLDGYTGVNCTHNIDDCLGNPCVNGGTCTDLVNDYRCTCNAGFTGTDCQTDIDDCLGVPCLNGGECTDGVNEYSCTCKSGFSGSSCETDIDECVSNPCLNDATCVDGIASYTCQCKAGFSGERCQTDIDDCASEPCLNGGSCTDGIDHYNCTCTEGFSGRCCEIDIDDCMSQPCLNGGTCTDMINEYNCACPDGFSGSHCQIGIWQNFLTGYFKLKAQDVRPVDPDGLGSVVVPCVQRCGTQCMVTAGCLSFTTQQIAPRELRCILYDSIALNLLPSKMIKYYIPTH